MERHEMPFPIEYTSPDSLIGEIERYWNIGVFDSYSEDHFLMRALKNDTDFFRNLLSKYHYSQDNVESYPFNFLVNFNIRLHGLCQYFGDDQIQGF